ncbi:MAG TPA: signal peptidase II [Gemmatimonadaceae bacterium]|jgi:signal peptidase II|nr:signal peptidase II [Gemmatimonadaceae bacterium]
MQRNNAGLFWPVLALVAAVDFGTKAIASTRLIPQGLPHTVYGEWIRFTLVHNPGAAFGLQMGNPQFSRWIFMVLTIVALVILGRLYVVTRAGDIVRTLSLALVCGGAMGNLIDRVRSTMGVVDFIDIGFGDSRWPTFNIADMAVSLGAFLLAWVLWGEDTAADRSTVPAQATIAGESGELS